MFETLQVMPLRCSKDYLKAQRASIPLQVIVLFFLGVVCLYLYSGFQNVYYTITQDHIPTYVGAKFVLSHPSFAFIVDYPHWYFLFYVLLAIVRTISNDLHWVNVAFILLIHIINAFLIFRICNILCNNKAVPGLFASLFFLVSIVHVDNVLDFTHSYPVFATFFALVSFYFFQISLNVERHHDRKRLFIAFLFYFISICCGENFIGLGLYYFIIIGIILIRRSDIAGLGRDGIYLIFIVLLFFGSKSILQNSLLKFYEIDYARPLCISPEYLLNRIRDYEYPFLYVTNLFFGGFAGTLATFWHAAKEVLDNSTHVNRIYRYFTIFMLFVPIIFFKKKAIYTLYSILVLMYLLFVPYLFSRVPLAARHITQTVMASSLFVGLLIHFSLESIYKIKIKGVRNVSYFIFVVCVGVVFLKYFVLTRTEVNRYIAYHSSFSACIEEFWRGYRRIEVRNPRKQIYLLKGEIPKRCTFMNSDEKMCYALFYLAVKFKNLPVELYSYVYPELQYGRYSDGRGWNYFISNSDGSCFGVFRSEDEIMNLINLRADIRSSDVIVLSWSEGLKQEAFREERS